MQLSDAELVSFRMRCHKASRRGHLMARADQYLTALTSEAGNVAPPTGTDAGSAEHLALLASAVLSARAKGVRPMPEPEVEPTLPVIRFVARATPAPTPAPEPALLKVDPAPKAQALPQPQAKSKKQAKSSGKSSN